MKNSNGKSRVSEVSGAGAQRQIAENGPKVGLGMESNMYGIPKGDRGFRRSVVLEHSNNSQKMDLEWASVWRAKCKEFHRKTKEFGGQWCWRILWNRRKWT